MRFSFFLLIGVHRAIRGSKTLFGFGIPAAELPLPAPLPCDGRRGGKQDLDRDQSSGRSGSGDGRVSRVTLGILPFSTCCAPGRRAVQGHCGPRPVLRSQRVGMRKGVEGNLARPALFHVLRAGTARGPGAGNTGRWSRGTRAENEKAPAVMAGAVTGIQLPRGAIGCATGRTGCRSRPGP